MIRNNQIPAQTQTLIFHMVRYFITSNMKSAGGLFIASHQECTPQLAKVHSGPVNDKESAKDCTEHTWVLV